MTLSSAAITFNNAVIDTSNTDGKNSVTINGTLNIDYISRFVSGTLTVTNPGGTETFSSFSIIENANGTNNLSSAGDVDPLHDTMLFAYQGTAPSSVTNVLLFKNGEEYTTSGNVPVSSRVTSCFASGTLMRAVDGDIAVEKLKVGDTIITAAGAQRPIRWIGHSLVACRGHQRPQDVLPIRVAAHAFGENLPARDLYLSPQHAVAVTCLKEVLIPIRHLINGATIEQVEVEEITYWHVELDSHDVILAENLPAESFLDTQGRGFFEGNEAFDLPKKSMADFCRPLVQDGPIVAALRAQLASHAQTIGWSITNDADMHLMVDGVRVDPVTTGRVSRFHLEASANDVRLCSRTFVPQVLEAFSLDERRLGVPLKSISVLDGLELNTAPPIDDPKFSSGFHVVHHEDAGWWRWTDGNAALDPALWSGARGDFFLRVELSERDHFRSWERLAVASTSQLVDLSSYRAKVA